MHPKISASDCLRAGRKAFLQRPLPLILGWAISASCVVLFVILFPSNLSLGLQLGAIASAPVLLWVQLVVLKSLGKDDSEGYQTRGSLLDWGSSFIASAVIPTLFRTVTWWLWVALPFSGGLMYAFMSWGVGGMFLCGRLDLLVFAILCGVAGFVVSSGLLFAPLCAIKDTKGPFDAMKRSWRMASGHRMKILRIAAICFWFPVGFFLSAYFLSVLRTTGAVFHGLPAVLWTISLITVVLFLGPWFSGALTALFVPLKAEEDAYMLRRVERKATMNLP